MKRMRDRRFTVSVAADLADRLDNYVSRIGTVNRSEAIEQALRLWEMLVDHTNKEEVLQEALRLYEKQKERELYRSYYAELGQKAKAEDKRWSELSRESADENWPGKRPRKATKETA